MAKSMWVRCPNCGHWCYAEEKGFLGRIARSLKIGDQQEGEFYGYYAGKIGMKGVGKTIGRVLNAANIWMHAGEMLNGDTYRFNCDNCGYEFGTDDEEYDQSTAHQLWDKAICIADKFNSVKHQSDAERKAFINEVERTLAQIENVSDVIPESKAIMEDVLACCYFFFDNDSAKALVEINKSLELFDDEKSHVLKGLFMGEVDDPSSNYEKMNELLKINVCEAPQYVDKNDIIRELEKAEKSYGENFASIPADERKFLVVVPEYTELPSSFKVIKYNDTRLSGINFANGFPSNNAIYVCHPYKPNTYYPSESYQTDLFQNQLNEFRELLQCLGAKSIVTEDALSKERSQADSSSLNGKVGGEYKGVGGNLSGEHKMGKSLMDSIVQKMLVDDSFDFNPDKYPDKPEGLVWFEHMEEWQRLYRMRLNGQNKYSISISSKSTHIVNANEANQVNADFNALVAKGNLEVSHSTELKVSEENSHEWKLVVEFYPLSEYHTPVKVSDNPVPAPKKPNWVVIAMGAIIALLIAVLLAILL